MKRLVAIATLGVVAAASISFAASSDQPQSVPPALTPSELGRSASQSFDVRSGRLVLSQSEREAAFRKGLLPQSARTLIATPGSLRHGEYEWDEEEVAPGPLLVWVDLRRQMISVFRGGDEIGTAVLVYGAKDKETPLGRFPILSKHRDYQSRAYDAAMPYAMFLTNDGVALHGSQMAADRATHGCVGLPDAFARRLFEAADVGDTVVILRSRT